MFIERTFDAYKMSDITYLAKLRTYWKHHQAFPSMTKLAAVWDWRPRVPFLGSLAALPKPVFSSASRGELHRQGSSSLDPCSGQCVPD